MTGPDQRETIRGPSTKRATGRFELKSDLQGAPTGGRHPSDRADGRRDFHRSSAARCGMQAPASSVTKNRLTRLALDGTKFEACSPTFSRDRRQLPFRKIRSRRRRLRGVRQEERQVVDRRRRRSARRFSTKAGPALAALAVARRAAGKLVGLMSDAGHQARRRDLQAPAGQLARVISALCLSRARRRKPNPKPVVQVQEIQEMADLEKIADELSASPSWRPPN